MELAEAKHSDRLKMTQSHPNDAFFTLVETFHLLLAIEQISQPLLFDNEITSLTIDSNDFSYLSMATMAVKFEEMNAAVNVCYVFFLQEDVRTLLFSPFFVVWLCKWQKESSNVIKSW